MIIRSPQYLPSFLMNGPLSVERNITPANEHSATGVSANRQRMKFDRPSLKMKVSVKNINKKAFDGSVKTFWIRMKLRDSRTFLPLYCTCQHTLSRHSLSHGRKKWVNGQLDPLRITCLKDKSVVPPHRKQREITWLRRSWRSTQNLKTPTRDKKTRSAA